VASIYLQSMLLIQQWTYWSICSVTMSPLLLLAKELDIHVTRCWVLKVWQNLNGRSRAWCWWVSSRAANQTHLRRFRHHRKLT